MIHGVSPSCLLCNCWFLKTYCTDLPQVYVSNCRLVVVLKLAKEAAAGASSAWSQYIASLPTETPNTPLRWTEQERALLHRTPVYSTYEQHCSDLQRALNAAAYMFQFACDINTEKLVEWAHAMALSRCIHLKEDGSAPSLIPVVDLLDHQPGSAACLRNLDDGSVALVHPSGVAEGKEITLDYGADKSNVKLLTGYGFCLVNNCEGQRESFPLQLKLNSAIPSTDVSLQRSMLCALHGHDHVELKLPSLHHHLAHLLASVEAQIAPEREVQYEADPYLSDGCELPSAGMSLKTRLNALSIVGSSIDEHLQCIQQLKHANASESSGFEFEKSVTTPDECIAVILRDLGNLLQKARSHIAHLAYEAVSNLQEPAKAFLPPQLAFSKSVERIVCFEQGKPTSWLSASARLFHPERTISIFEYDCIFAASAEELSSKLLRMQHNAWNSHPALRAFVSLDAPLFELFPGNSSQGEMLADAFAQSLRRSLDDEHHAAKALADTEGCTVRQAAWARAAARCLSRKASVMDDQCHSATTAYVICPIASLLDDAMFGSLLHASLIHSGSFSYVHFMQAGDLPALEPTPEGIEVGSLLDATCATAEELMLTYASSHFATTAAGGRDTSTCSCIALSVESYDRDWQGGIRQRLLERCGLEDPTFLGSAHKQFQPPKRLLAQSAIAIADITQNKPLAEAAQRLMHARRAFDHSKSSDDAAALKTAIRHVVSVVVLPDTSMTATACNWIAQGLESELYHHLQENSLSNRNQDSQVRHDATALAWFLQAQHNVARAWYSALVK